MTCCDDSSSTSGCHHRFIINGPCVRKLISRRKCWRWERRKKQLDVLIAFRKSHPGTATEGVESVSFMNCFLRSRVLEHHLSVVVQFKFLAWQEAFVDQSICLTSLT